jgi:hypothetical protein
MGKSILLKYMSEPSGDISESRNSPATSNLFKKIQVVAHGMGG